MSDLCPLYPPKADMDQSGCDVRFVPKADILRCGRPLRNSADNGYPLLPWVKSVRHAFEFRNRVEVVDPGLESEQISAEVAPIHFVGEALHAHVVGFWLITSRCMPSDWSVKRRLEYVRWAREVAKGLRGINLRQ